MKTGGIYPPVAKRQRKKLLLHCAHDNASKCSQYTAACAAADNLTKDVSDVHAASCVTTKHAAQCAAEKLSAADAANSTCKQLGKKRHSGGLHKVAHNTTTGSAGNSLDDEWKESFHILKSRFITPSDLSSQAE
jgi:hypothetical protein